MYKIISGFYQAVRCRPHHPARERALRALQRSVDYIEEKMPDALGFETQRELIEYSLQATEAKDTARDRESSPVVRSDS